MQRYAGKPDRDAIEAEMPWADRGLPATMYRFMAAAARDHGPRDAISFQLTSGPGDPAETLTWDALHSRTTQAANMFRALGVGEGDVVAYLLPNCTEAAVTLIGGAIAGIANPINPLLAPDQIAAILRQTGAKVLVTLRAFPKADIAQRAAEALALAPGVTTVLEVDLLRYLSPPKSWVAGLIRPKTRARHRARVLPFTATIDRHRGEALDFADSAGDRVGAYFHTGGTTGMPKVAQHSYGGMIYNGWLGARLLFRPGDNVMCPLPLFHVFACHVTLMAMIASGAHVIFPTPAGYRGDGVFDNMWKLIERWRVTFVIIVPTALSALMQRPVDADISSLKTAFCGSSPLPLELYRRFEAASGVTLIEGYGLTECTCLVSVNPTDGEKRIGSVGIPFPYTEVRIVADDGRDCAADEVGEICVANPGVLPGRTYTDSDKNHDLYRHEQFLRTGDLGRIDADGYLWITGRAKDLIIRGGHNIDPAIIEEALAAHQDVAMAGAVGQPDAHSGEVPCAYVELVSGASVTGEELRQWLRPRIAERGAAPRHVEVVHEMPTTAVGKVFKPDLRRRAIARVYDAALTEAGVKARVVEVSEHPRNGLTARLARNGEQEDAGVAAALSDFTRPWEWAE